MSDIFKNLPNDIKGNIIDHLCNNHTNHRMMMKEIGYIGDRMRIQQSRVSFNLNEASRIIDQRAITDSWYRVFYSLDNRQFYYDRSIVGRFLPQGLIRLKLNKYLFNNI
tara:strand:+ start:49 stop:375 length:327 start_codon:yes stop_codon:yes gene_type:complete